MSLTNKIEQEKKNAFEMFNAIAPNYDLVNRVLSGGIDLYWRQKVIAALPLQNEMAVLDVATGTGDLLLALAKDERIKSVLGIDISAGMIEVAKKKRVQFLTHCKPEKALDIELEIALGDALSLEDFFQEYESPKAQHQNAAVVNSFDVVTLAFGIRNMTDVPRVLSQIYKVLKPGAKLLILEFSTPKNLRVQKAYGLYRRHILPKLGGWLSGHITAYQYLDQTIAEFPSGDAFCKIMTEAGFVKCKSTSLTLGVVSLYEAYKEQKCV